MIQQDNVPVYSAVPGAHISDKDAAIIGPFLEQLIEQYGRFATPQEIVASAEAVDSPIHRYFEWDNTEAAIQYRLHQARVLSRSWQVRIVEKDIGEPIVMRGMISVITNTDTGERAYTTTKHVLEEPELLQQVIHQAAKQLKYWRNQYQQYRNVQRFKATFEPLFRFIEELEEV